jgi:hypothetical protein
VIHLVTLEKNAKTLIKQAFLSVLLVGMGAAIYKASSVGRGRKETKMSDTFIRVHAKKPRGTRTFMAPSEDGYRNGTFACFSAADSIWAVYRLGDFQQFQQVWPEGWLPVVFDK